MKIYQLIYTAVKHSLTEPELGLVNQPGYRVYSCSQGLTKDEVNEVVRYCGYRLPKNNAVKCPTIPFDPQVPDMFPKTFRTFKLDSGKYAAIQVVYSGYDWDGDEGNFFAHAFIVDSEGEPFAPESLYGSESFKKYLTPAETNAMLVKYLPVLESVDTDSDLKSKVDTFVANHKIQMSAIMEQAMSVFVGDEKTHICISAKNVEESNMYALGLKRILPRSLSDKYGLSTNNVFLPSSGQHKIIINCTVTGINNITDEDVERRTNCVYIDVQRIETDGVKPMKLFEKTMDELHKSYEEFSIENGQQLAIWLNSSERLTEEGVGSRLNDLYELVGEKLFVQRTESVYEMLNQANMQQVKFEVLEVMFRHMELFRDKAQTVTEQLFIEGVRCICDGEPKNLEDIFRGADEETGKIIYNKLNEIMAMIDCDKVDFKSGALILRLFAMLKNTLGYQTWKDFFKDNKEYMTVFVSLCAKVMISDTSPIIFTAPANWLGSDTAEAIAYIDSSADDDEIHIACKKYVMEHKSESWRKYGVILQKKRKSKEESEKDLLKIRQLLTTVGYVPYQRGSYNDLKYEVLNQMSTNENPLLLVRLLYAIYSWQGTSDRRKDAGYAAQEVYELILEMRETELSCYRFIFPKLALEILDCPGYYHEMIINTETMEPGFWDWFYIGYKKNMRDDLVRENYEHVLDANYHELAKLPIFKKLKNL